MAKLLTLERVLVLPDVGITAPSKDKPVARRSSDVTDSCELGPLIAELISLEMHSVSARLKNRDRGGLL